MNELHCVECGHVVEDADSIIDNFCKVIAATPEDDA